MSSIQLQKYLDLLPENAILNAGIAIAGLSAAYAIGLVIYRLYLSPISKFPGPKIAAATFWYELYYDVIHKGQYFHKIEEMHEKYGTYHDSFPRYPGSSLCKPLYPVDRKLHEF